jgi:hypothetical protein
MHTGRTIEELIELVQHIHTHNGDRPRASHDLAARDRNARHHNDRQRYDQQRYDQQRYDQDNPERPSSGRTPQGSPTAQPAWLAVFL